MIDKVIFLDIDGVLNCQSSKSKCAGFIGVDNSKVKILKEIVDKTNAKIILISSWKNNWEKDKDIIRYDGKYLDKKLKKQGLYILDKTKDSGSNRGEGIYNFIKENNVKYWVVIDDVIFYDYRKYGINDHLVKTEFYKDDGGLQEKHIKIVINILNGEIK